MDTISNIFLVTYAYTKNFGSFIKVYMGDTVFKIFGGILSSLVLLILGILLVPFVLLQFCLYIYLKLVYKELYDRFLSGVHTFYEIGQHNTVINIIIVYSCVADKPTRIRILKQLVSEIYNSSYKFSCTVQQFFGFLFLLKNQVKTEDLLEVIEQKGDDYMAKATLYNYIERNCSTINSNRTWKVTGFTQPIDWGQNKDDIKQYVVILTTRHCIGDGFAVFATLNKIFSKDFKTKTTLVKEISFKRPRITLNNAYIHTNIFTMNKDYRLLKNKHSSNWSVVTYIEPKPKYILSIKVIKKQLRVDFTDVIGAAICASVKDYIVQRQLAINSFTFASMVRVYEEEMLQIINKTYNFKKLTNTSTTEMYTISFGPGEKDMKGKILFMHRATKLLRKSLDFFVPYVVLRSVFSYVPINVTRFAFGKCFDGVTVAITNLVGFDKCSYDDFNIDDIHFCVPQSLSVEHVYTPIYSKKNMRTYTMLRYLVQLIQSVNTCLVGFLYCIFSYDGRFGITLQSGRGYVRNREELQTILDNTLKYIDQAESEIVI